MSDKYTQKNGIVIALGLKHDCKVFLSRMGEGGGIIFKYVYGFYLSYISIRSNHKM